MTIDLDSWSLYLSRKWHVNDNGYAVWRGVDVDGAKRTHRFHRLVAETPEGLGTDHVNHVRTDNRKVNLRVVTQSENMRNLTDQGKGYWYHRQSGKWAVQRFRERPGLYKTEAEARAVAEAISTGQAYAPPIYGRTNKETHCKNGHEYATVGFYHYPHGENLRKCKRCQSLSSAEYYKRKNDVNLTKGI